METGMITTAAATISSSVYSSRMSLSRARVRPPPVGVCARLASPTAARRPSSTAPVRAMRRRPVPPPMAEWYGPLALGESGPWAAGDQPGERGKHERGHEARERRGEVDRGGVGVSHQVLPPGRPLRREPLVEAEADEPGEDHLRPHRRPVEDLLSAVVGAFEQPV